MTASRCLRAGAAFLLCAGILTGAATAGDTPETSRYPFFRHIDGKRAMPQPLPFLNASPEAAALRRIHHSTVNATPDWSPNDSQFNTQIVSLGGSKLLAVFEDSGEFDGTHGGGNDHVTGYAFSGNNGFSWTDGGHLPNTPKGDYGRPSLAVDSATGAAYLAENDLGNPDGPTQIMVFKSTDSGHSFGAPTNGAPGVTEQPFGPRIAVDNFAGANNGNVYLCWEQFVDIENPTTGRIMFSRSLDDGATFAPSGGLQISVGGDGCFVVAGPSDRVYVFYYKGNGPGGIGGNNKLFVRKSEDAGLTFGSAVRVADLNTTSPWGFLRFGPLVPSFPIAAVNPVADRPYLYVVYNDDPLPLGGGDRGDTYYVKSTDQGATWSAPVRINDIRAGVQFFPDIAFASGGESVLFTYNSLDPLTGFYHRRGRLGVLNGTSAITLNPSFQLSPDSQFVFGQDPYEVFYSGEYEGSAGGVGAISTLWSDTRLGNAFHLNQPDVRFARIVVPPPTTDLALTITPSPANIKLGENSVLTVTVTATGGPANDAFVSIPSPFGLALRTAASGNGQCTTLGNQVGCSLGRIPSGGSRSLQVIVTGIYGAATRTVKAIATTSSNDTIPENNHARAKITVSTTGSLVRTSSTGNVHIAIPDGKWAGITFRARVEREGVAVQAAVGVRIDHAFDGDLDMFLMSPLGTVIPLSIRNGSSGDNYGSGPLSCAGAKTVFTDLAAKYIWQGVPPFAGEFKPEIPIATALGEPSDGVWHLFFRDLFKPDEGVLGCATLTLTIAK